MVSRKNGDGNETVAAGAELVKKRPGLHTSAMTAEKMIRTRGGNARSVH